MERKYQENKERPDPDMTFFTTLSSHMKQIKPESKLLFRQEVAEIVWKYAYGETSKTSERAGNVIDDDVIIIEPKRRRLRRSCPPRTGYYQPTMAQVQPWTDWRQMPYQLPIKSEEPKWPVASLGDDVKSTIPKWYYEQPQAAQPLPSPSPAIPQNQVPPNDGHQLPGPSRNTNSIPQYYYGLPQATQPGAAVAQTQYTPNERNQLPGPSRNTYSQPQYCYGLPQAAQPAAAVPQMQIQPNQFVGPSAAGTVTNYQSPEEFMNYTELPPSTSQEKEKTCQGKP